MDISPNQKPLGGGLKSELFNFRTGEMIPVDIPKNILDPPLSVRELEILKMINEGFLSKEISARLSISVHTVNTHRQKVLEKLRANNSLEAVKLATKL